MFGGTNSLTNMLCIARRHPKEMRGGKGSPGDTDPRRAGSCFQWDLNSRLGWGGAVHNISKFKY